METEKRMIDANAIPWEECYVPDPDSNDQWDYKKELSVTKSIVDQMPTVDAVEVVHGRWKNVKETEVYSPDHRCTFTHTAKTCSVCNVRIGFIGANFYLYDAYCPNCGAKMDGDGNG